MIVYSVYIVHIDDNYSVGLNKQINYCLLVFKIT